MKKKIITGVCGLVLVAAFSFACPVLVAVAFADQSVGYQEYFNEGVKAFKEHDDQKALRSFKIAQIYDSSDEQLNNYISILEKRAVSVEQHSSLHPDESVGYRYYLNKGIEAFQAHDNKKAAHYFNIAIIFNPDSKEADQYLENLGQAVSQVSSQPSVPVVQEISQPQALPSVQSQETQQPQVNPQQVPSTAASEVSKPAPSTQPPQAVSVPQAPAVKSQGAVYVTAPKAKMPTQEISLAQISNNGQANPKLQIDLNSSVILDGKNIQRFLVVEENFIGVKILDTDRIKIDALKIGTTFIHIWDDSGRHTLYVEVVFPKFVNDNGSLAPTDGMQHAQPFRVTYTNDWSTYYQGKNLPELKRQSYELNQTLSVSGETPYGIFDTSGSYTDFNSFSQFDTYTIGLSQIPVEGTSNLNLRGFDALRYLSPLTMPGTRLRGEFADVDLMDDMIGLSFSHGQQQEPLGFISMGESQFTKSYIDAAKLTLFPRSNTDQYSFNFATASGPERQRYLAQHVYSVEGLHKFNRYLSLNAEEASDASHASTLASLKWQDGVFRSGINFRNIDKNYATVSSLPANQGETGGAWVSNLDMNNLSASSFVEAYQDHLNSNPNQPRALNYDVNENVRANITQSLWSDTDFNYVDTPGELSPNRSLGFNERISKSFGVWNSLKGTVFSGVGYQTSHSSDSNFSNYDRENVITGVQLPLTSQVSIFSNYEYDWLHQPNSGGTSYPSVINSGLEYSKQFTPKFSVNSQLVYRDELGVRGDSSFLSGERSVMITSGFAYNPTSDMSVFADANASKILSHIGNPSYDDFEVHIGMRLTFGGATYWDPLGTVSGVVFKDRNGDGKFVSEDEGIPGVKVKVGDKVAVTDKNGRYRIQVRAKGVQVAPESDTVPGGLIFSTPQFLNVQIIQGHITHADFGLLSQTGVYGIVFVDNNGTKIPSDGDKFIGKVRIILDDKVIQKSDSHGAFYFRKVAPGPHTISIDINTLTLNMVPLVKLRTKIDVAEGTNYMFNIPVQIKKAEGADK